MIYTWECDTMLDGTTGSFQNMYFNYGNRKSLFKSVKLRSFSKTSSNLCDKGEKIFLRNRLPIAGNKAIYFAKNVFLRPKDFQK